MTTKPSQQSSSGNNTTGTETSTDTGAGLVQKLCFPGFTNSGASDAFAAKASSAAVAADDKDNHEPTPSEAETDVYDNRSTPFFTRKQHQQQ